MPQLSQIYFDMQPPRGQGGNFMQEMLGSLMGGGASGGGDSSNGKSATPVTIRHAPPPRMPTVESKDETAQIVASASSAEDELDLD